MSRSKKERERIRAARKGERQADSLIDRLNRTLYGVASDVIAGLLTDAAGRLLFNVRNIEAANRVGIQISGTYQSRGGNIGQRLVRGLLQLFNINVSYFRQAETPRPLTQGLESGVLRLLMAQYGYNTDTASLDPNGYLLANLRNNGHAQSVAQRITQAVAAREKLTTFRRTFRGEFLNSPGSALSAHHHFNRFARDLYQEFDRTTNNTFANQLGLEYAIYSGTVKDNTRHFCERRVNRIYTGQKIDEWNSQQWQGKKQNVDVRIALGGYNCRHVLSWISEETAQALAERRDIEINSYNSV